jgi:endonuclease/exonuclease/phosphatase family metal-dependent hydrolase
LIVDNFDRFAPVVGDAARYLAKAGDNWNGEWNALGARILQNAASPIASNCEYVEMVLYGLFAVQVELNHSNKLMTLFDKVRPAAKRELLMAAKASKQGEWLHSLRRRAGQFDPWLRRAYINSLSVLPTKQATECIKSIEIQPQSTDAILLGHLMSERVDHVAGRREPLGAAWQAVLAIVPKQRRAFVEDQLDSLGDALAKHIYKNRSGKYLLGTWNLRNFGGAAFGFGERLSESLAYVARVILAFDMVAIQEVQSKELIERLLKLLGTEWDMRLSGEATGAAGNKERCAFLFRRSQVIPQGLVEPLVLSGKKELILSKYQFKRPPFLVEVKIGDWKLIAASAHIYFGAATGVKLKHRVAEITALAEKIMSRGKQYAAIPILMGDLNVVAPDHATMEPLKHHGIALPPDLLAPTNVAGDKFYTQIAFLPTHQGPRVATTGVFKVFDYVFRDCDQDRYAAEMESSDTLSSQKKVTGDQALVSYKHWRTYQVSDHYPVWVDLS